MELLKAIHSIGRLPDDDEITITRKKFLDYQAIGTSIGATVMGILLSSVSMYGAVVTFCFIPFTLINYLFYYRFKHFFLSKHWQTFMGLCIPLAVQAFLGGFAASGGYMFWSLVAMIVALPYHDMKESIAWSAICVFLCGVMFWFDGDFVRQFGTVTSPHSTKV